MFNISRVKAGFPSHMELNRNLLSAGVRLLTPMADLQDSLIGDLTRMVEGHRLTRFDTNNIGELFAYNMGRRISERDSYFGDSNSITFTSVEELSRLTPTRIERLDDYDGQTDILCYYDVEAGSLDYGRYAVTGEQQYLVISGFNGFSKKVGETDLDYPEAITISGRGIDGELLEETVGINGNELFNLTNIFYQVDGISHPIATTTGSITVYQGKPAEIEPSLKRTWYANGEKRIYISIDPDYTDGLRLSYKIAPDVSDDEYESLYKCYLANQNGEQIKPISFCITEKDECYVLDETYSIHYYASLWPDLQFPTIVKSQNPYVQILMDATFYEFDDPVEVQVTTGANSHLVKEVIVKLIDPLGDIEYLQADLTFGEDAHTFYELPPSIYFRFSPVLTGTYQIQTIITDIEDELHYNQAYAIVVGLAADKTSENETPYISINCYGDNQLALFESGSTYHIYQLHYDYGVINGSTILTVENYDTVEID